MILEKIEIDKNNIVYKGIIGLNESFNKEEFIKKIKYIQHLYPDFTNSMNEKTPGKQYPILVNLEEINFIINKVKTSLKNDDGYLYFKTKNGKEFGFLPKEDEVWIFPGDLEHDVKTNTSSTNERIVIASNIHFFDYNDIKLEKSIL